MNVVRMHLGILLKLNLVLERNFMAVAKIIHFQSNIDGLKHISSRRVSFKFEKLDFFVCNHCLRE